MIRITMLMSRISGPHSPQEIATGTGPINITTLPEDLMSLIMLPSIIILPITMKIIPAMRISVTRFS